MRFGGTVLVLAMLLGACSSDPAPREPAATATSATPTTSPPTMPDQAEEDTPEGAAAFVDHYVDVFNYAARTGDVEELSRLSSPDCEPCQKYAADFRRLRPEDRAESDAWTIGDLVIKSGDPVTVETRVKVAGESKAYRLEFELAVADPYIVAMIAERA